VPENNEPTDQQQAWSLLTEDEKEVFGRALDAIVWVTRPRLRNFIFRKQYQQEVLELAGKALTGALGAGYGTGFRAVEQFAALANTLEGANEKERKQMLQDFLQHGSV
jgi:hypothetical protein